MSWTPREQPENPFVAAGRPSYIGGRFEQRQAAYDWVRADARQSFVVTGARGTGKTTLATWVADQLTYHRDEQLPVVYCRGDVDLPLLEQVLSGTASSTTSEVSAGVPWLRTATSVTTSAAAPTSLRQALRPDTYVVVDEAQRLQTDDLSQLAAYLEHPSDEFSGQVMLLGTPMLHARFADPDGSYGLFARGPSVVMTPHQSVDEVADLIEGTIDGSDIRFDAEAVEEVAVITDGYPPAVQTLCAEAVQRTDRVSLAQIQQAEPKMHQRLERLFQQMLQRQGRTGRPPTGRNAVLAELANQPRTAAELGQLTGRASSSISKIRSDLLDAGLVDVDSSGTWSLSIPLMRHQLADENLGRAHREERDR